MSGPNESPASRTPTPRATQTTTYKPQKIFNPIQAKTLMSSRPTPDPWFGCKYTINIYRGCQHRCIYCDSRSECYQIDNFDTEILYKENAIEKLQDEISRKRIKGTISFGSMNDAYMPIEKKFKFTRQALKIIAQYRFPIHLMIKSDLVLRDIDIIKQISEVYAAISFTITAADDELSKKIEPGAPPSSARFEAMRKLSQDGIYTGVSMMPILPFIEDTEENITSLIEKAHKAGAKYILPAFGMTLRNRQREYYYDRLDELFPRTKQKYQKAFKFNYEAPCPNADKLFDLTHKLCTKYGISLKMDFYEPPKPSKQLKLA